MRIKKIIGEKVYLSPFNPDDMETYAQFLNDLDVTQYLSLSASYITPESERQYLESPSSNTSIQDYSVIDKLTDRLIGSAGLDRIDSLNRSAEFGIFIGDKEYWGRGYGCEAACLVLDYGFRRLNLHTVMLHVYSFNPRAIKCYKKIGFKLAGTLRESVCRGGKYYDRYIMDMTADEFYFAHPEFDRSKM